MGSSNYARRAEKRATAAETERQSAMADATGRVNAVFDSPGREAQQTDFLEALRERYMTDANRQKRVADRNLKFSMARGGLTGGSAAVDANRTLGEEYSEGIVKAESGAQGALGDLKAQDEASRMGILQMIRSGLDATTAASRAGAAMQSNAQVASGRAFGEGLGDMFGNTASLYKTQQEAAERRRGEKAAMGTIYGKGAFGA
jgi:peptidoglycan hydrolase-like amidase